ncbi:MAG TPA: hypothetical protein VGQ87_00385 [Patescibacteria group bacterium]|jgi:hypothetical protein|nr:hypothetical protein [Patescibacteria group bacterium]
MFKKILVVMAAFFAVPSIMLAADNPTISSSVLGDDCLIRVFHTDFAFPPEGGKIIKIGSAMYFARDYLPGCENSASRGQLVQASPTGAVVAGTTTTNTRFQAPQTGIKSRCDNAK